MFFKYDPNERECININWFPTSPEVTQLWKDMLDSFKNQKLLTKY